MKALTNKIVIMAMGGVLLMIATVLFDAFISAPPTRAEFDAFKAQNIGQYKEISGKLETLEDGQKSIINHLLRRK